MNNVTRLKTLFFVLLFASFLAACGQGDGEDGSGQQWSDEKIDLPEGQRW